MRIEKEMRVLLENGLWCVKSICMVPNAYAHADWREQRAERTQHPDAGSPLPRAGSWRLRTCYIDKNMPTYVYIDR